MFLEYNVNFFLWVKVNFQKTLIMLYLQNSWVASKKNPFLNLSGLQLYNQLRLEQEAEQGTRGSQPTSWTLHHVSRRGEMDEAASVHLRQKQKQSV